MIKQLKDERLYIRLTKSEKDKLIEIANKENRTLSNLVHLMILEKIDKMK